MQYKKLGFFLFVFLFATMGQGAGENDQKEKFINAINYLSKLVEQKYQISTTGYQTAMTKKGIFITLKRGEQYTSAAKKAYPISTLKNLAILQSSYINKLPETGDLSSPHDFTGPQLSGVLERAREKNFANCEMQALEIAIHLYALGFKKFKIWSNKGISHNYVVLSPTTLFPKGAIVDPWKGFDLRELDFKMIAKYKHYKENIMVVQNMMDWLDKNAITYANKWWIATIRMKFFPGESSTPLEFIQ